jgi:general L-amino acid transport system ATP-binding protein
MKTNTACKDDPGVACGTDTAVDISGLCKWYGDYQVLDGVSFTVRRAERIVICGRSGSGKSTLIRCINRLERYQAGRIVVDGITLNDDLRRIDEVRRDVGMVFQSFNLFPHMTILENCCLAPMLVRGMKRPEAERLALHFLEKVKIPDQSGKFPVQLSGGQQQRAAIARALCMKPRIMLFDEPTSALDPEMIKEVLDTIIAVTEEGMTMLCVTHEMGFARSVADRIVFMEQGQIIEATDPHSFFTAPKHKSVRQFVEQVRTIA